MADGPAPQQVQKRPAADEPAWHHAAAVYQVYLRSFADGNGDGIGDLAGLRARLPYLRDLGVDAIWLTPWYVSPMADGGYDVADYRDIDPVFGTLAGAEALIRAVHDHQLKIIIDIVPNHCSNQHRWFTAALAAAPGSAERARFWFRPGRGQSGDRPPNDWQSMFGGPAWTRAAPTSTRARNLDCGKSRTSPTSSSPTPCTSRPAISPRSRRLSRPAALAGRRAGLRVRPRGWGVAVAPPARRVAAAGRGRASS